MNQIRYVLDACLIVVMGLLAIYLYTTFPSGDAGSGESNLISVVTKESPAVMNSKGYQVFRQQCGSCHHLTKRLVGPPLQGVLQRGPWAENVENLKKWLRNPKEFSNSSPYAKSLIVEYGLTMPGFENLADDDIEAILGYLAGKQEAAK